MSSKMDARAAAPENAASHHLERARPERSDDDVLLVRSLLPDEQTTDGVISGCVGRCPDCGKPFELPKNLNKHIKQRACSQWSSRQKSLARLGGLTCENEWYCPYEADMAAVKTDITSGELEVALAMAHGSALDAAVLAAMASVYIPLQSRQNVKKGSRRRIERNHALEPQNSTDTAHTKRARLGDSGGVVNHKANARDIRGMPLGIINTRRGIHISRLTRSRQRLTKLLVHWARAACPRHRFTSIQVGLPCSIAVFLLVEQAACTRIN